MKKKTVSAITLTLLLTSMLTLASNIQPVKAEGTIYIRADGSIDPSDAPISSVDNITYTFTANINESIVVERNNIVVDGAGYTLNGTALAMPGYTLDGIYLSYISNVTITNLEITSFGIGVELYYADGNTICGNNLTDGSDSGVAISYSNYNHVEGNRILNNSISGIYISYSSHNVISGNTLVENIVGIMGENSCNNNIISENNITAPEHLMEGVGVEFYQDCQNNEIDGNNIDGSHTFYVGISLSLCWNCSVSRNTIMNVDVEDSSAIQVVDAPAGIFENTIKNNYIGITMYPFINASYMSVHAIYHNNMVNNQYQVIASFPWLVVWDGGYPSGGNYWSDYIGTDLKSGPYQNETGADGIGDTPYDNYVLDRYPLMGPFGGITNQGTDVVVFPSENVGLIFGSVETGGSVTVTESLAGPAPPSGFMISSGIYYDIETTATWSGTAIIRIIYDDSGMTLEQESTLRLMQWNETSNSWVDITQRVDTENNVIYGEASHFSIVAVVARTPISWEFVFQDSRRGTTLKISTDDKYFQFVAPNKDFGAKHDPNMIVSRHLIIIIYGDPELRLEAIAVHDKIDFCLAIAWDKTTGKKYLLID